MCSVGVGVGVGGAEGNMYTGEGRAQDHSNSEDCAVCICTEGECAFCWGEGKKALRGSSCQYDV